MNLAKGCPFCSFVANGYQFPSFVAMEILRGALTHTAGTWRDLFESFLLAKDLRRYASPDGCVDAWYSWCRIYQLDVPMTGADG